MLQALMKMLTRPIASPAVEALYTACIAQARQPVFYAEMAVPDTVDGRFDLLLLHVFIVVQRLRPHPEEAQQLFDLMFADMDRNLREMGVSDISIAKKIKPMLSAFYGRAQAYDQAMELDDTALQTALARNIYGGHAEEAKLRRLTKYARDAHTAVASQNSDDILNGHIAFPLIEDK